jgi:hypothetical protein
MAFRRESMVSFITNSESAVHNKSGLDTYSKLADSNAKRRDSRVNMKNIEKHDISEIPTSLHTAVHPLSRRPLTLPTKQSTRQYRQNEGTKEEIMQFPLPTRQSMSPPTRQSAGQYRQDVGIKAEPMQLPLPTRESAGQYRQDAGIKAEPMWLPQPTRQSTSLPTNPAKLTRKRHNYRHALYIAICQLIYGSIAVTLGYLAYCYFAAWPVYRVVAFVVIIIAWSNIASATARKKSVDMLATVKVQAIRLGDRKRSSGMDSPALTQDTTTYLRVIKASFSREKL